MTPAVLAAALAALAVPLIAWIYAMAPWFGTERPIGHHHPDTVRRRLPEWMPATGDARNRALLDTQTMPAVDTEGIAA